MLGTWKSDAIRFIAGIDMQEQEAWRKICR